MWGKSLEAIVAALKGIGGGYFVVRDDAGDEFFVMPRREFERLSDKGNDELQLSLPSASTRPLRTKPAPQPAVVEPDADEVLERINREIALYQENQQEEEAALSFSPDDRDDSEAGMRVRFEPLKGDLPPELQE